MSQVRPFTPMERIEMLEEALPAPNSSPSSWRTIGVTESDIDWLLRVAKAAVAWRESQVYRLPKDKTPIDDPGLASKLVDAIDDAEGR